MDQLMYLPCVYRNGFYTGNISEYLKNVKFYSWDKLKEMEIAPSRVYSKCRWYGPSNLPTLSKEIPSKDIKFEQPNIQASFRWIF